MLTGSLQGIAERPLPCIYNEIQLTFTAVTRVQISPGTPNPFNNLQASAAFPTGTK
jgi:hypothetical protein